MILFEDITTFSGILLILALGLALAFEFVNGFHDTANAVATVIYAHALKPNHAVIWSGCMNLLGVLTSSGTVAFGIIALLPVELVVKVDARTGFTMVFALLISAIIWNVGTWYLGLPTSSSHALIGSILGIGFANSIVASSGFGEGLNWTKAQEVFAALLISPLVGFTAAALLLLVAKVLINQPALYEAPIGKAPPPWWIRGLLILTCTGVSFAHGSNDGQKGMGLIMLILIGTLPSLYALDLSTDAATLNQLSAAHQAAMVYLDKRAPNGIFTIGTAASEQLTSFLHNKKVDENVFSALVGKTYEVGQKLNGKIDLNAVAKADRRTLRGDIYLIEKTISTLNKKNIFKNLSERETLIDYKKQLSRITEFIPTWIKFTVVVALGLGTLIGWERIVITVGEKIGKDHLT